MKACKFSFEFSNFLAQISELQRILSTKYCFANVAKALFFRIFRYKFTFSEDAEGLREPMKPMQNILYHEYLSIKRSRSKEIFFLQRLSHNVFLKTSFSQRLSHNVFLTTYFSQCLSHTVSLTLSTTWRSPHNFAIYG